MIENDMYNFDGYSTFSVRNWIKCDKLLDFNGFKFKIRIINLFCIIVKFCSYNMTYKIALIGVKIYLNQIAFERNKITIQLQEKWEPLKIKV